MEASGNINNDNTEKMLKFQLMSQMFKEMCGDDENTFSLVMESLVQSAKDAQGNIDIDKLMPTDMSELGFGGKERLNNVNNYVNRETKTGSVSIDEAIEKASKKYGIDSDFLKSVIKQESGFNTKAVSSAGAMGLMQLMPSTASGLGVKDPFNAEQNIDGGTKYLKDLLNMYGNSKEMALAAYNAGPGTVKYRGMKSPSDLYKMPKETQNYVESIIKNYGK